MGNGGFPPLQWLSDWLPEGGRKVGVCGKRSTGMETPHDPVILGNVKLLAIMLNNFNSDGDHHY